MHILLAIPLFWCLLLLFFLAILRRKKTLVIFALLLIFALNIYAEIISFGRFIRFREEKSDITILAYNIHNKSKDYKAKQADVAKFILSLSPDIAYLCEFELWRNKQLDNILTNDAYKRYYITGTNCVFYSKHAIDSIVGIHSKESIKKHSLNNKVHVFIGKDTLTIVGCHLSSSNHHIMRGYQYRTKEADAIYDNIKDEQYPTIVMGDLNDISGSYAVERIKEAGLKDAWWKGGFGYGSTFHDRWLRLRLDHILYQDNKLDLEYVKVIDSNLSDHNALVAGFSIKK